MKKKKIVVIDDERDICFLMKEIFERTEKYEVVVAYNGEEGKKTVIEEKPDLIFLDYIMPKAKGNAVLRYFSSQEEVKIPPIILMSGLGWALAFEESDPLVSWICPEKRTEDQIVINGQGWKSAPEDIYVNYGIVMYIMKPFSSQTLLFVVDKVLSGSLPSISGKELNAQAEIDKEQ